MNKIEMYFNCVKRVLKSTTLDLNISNKKIILDLSISKY